MRHLTLAITCGPGGQMVAAHVPGEEQADLRRVPLRSDRARRRRLELHCHVPLDHVLNGREHPLPVAIRREEEGHGVEVTAHVLIAVRYEAKRAQVVAVVPAEVDLIGA
eukprot:9111903-Pyramimonas_sp.AAC.1